RPGVQNKDPILVGGQRQPLAVGAECDCIHRVPFDRGVTVNEPPPRRRLTNRHEADSTKRDELTVRTEGHRDALSLSAPRETAHLAAGARVPNLYHARTVG